MSREVRSWHLARRSDKALDDLARMFNSIVQGWINYYWRFYKSELLSFGGSTGIWRGGSAGSSNGCAGENDAPWRGWPGRTTRTPAVRALAIRRTS